jgi:DNA-binding NtrC family response regulator
MTAVAPRILIVDDERFFREAIRGALEELGVECELVETGEEALKAAEDPRVGVVVLDVRLPGIGGVEVLERLRAWRPALRVIVLSAHTDQDLVLEALRLGATDYLAKPIHEEELRLAVRRALEAHAVDSRW